MKEFKEVHIDYFDEEEGCWLVDGWETDADEEEGQVLAKIYPSEDNLCVAKVEELIPQVMQQETVKKAVKEKVDELFNEDIAFLDEEGMELLEELYKIAIRD